MRRTITYSKKQLTRVAVMYMAHLCISKMHKLRSLPIKVCKAQDPSRQYTKVCPPTHRFRPHTTATHLTDYTCNMQFRIHDFEAFVLVILRLWECYYPVSKMTIGKEYTRSMMEVVRMRILETQERACTVRACFESAMCVVRGLCTDTAQCTINHKLCRSGRHWWLCSRLHQSATRAIYPRATRRARGWRCRGPRCG